MTNKFQLAAQDQEASQTSALEAIAAATSALEREFRITVISVGSSCVFVALPPRQYIAATNFEAALRTFAQEQGSIIAGLSLPAVIQTNDEAVDPCVEAPGPAGHFPVMVDGKPVADVTPPPQYKKLDNRDWEINNALRDASGNRKSTDPLVHFLYLLMRDHMPAGTVEGLVREAIKNADAKYSNGFIVDYVEHILAQMRK